MSQYPSILDLFRWMENTLDARAPARAPITPLSARPTDGFATLPQAAPRRGSRNWLSDKYPRSEK
jgi:hypothetical protein